MNQKSEKTNHDIPSLNNLADQRMGPRVNLLKTSLYFDVFFLQYIKGGSKTNEWKYIIEYWHNRESTLLFVHQNILVNISVVVIFNWLWASIYVGHTVLFGNTSMDYVSSSGLKNVNYIIVVRLVLKILTTVYCFSQYKTNPLQQQNSVG